MTQRKKKTGGQGITPRATSTDWTSGKGNLVLLLLLVLQCQIVDKGAVVVVVGASRGNLISQPGHLPNLQLVVINIHQDTQVQVKLPQQATPSPLVTPALCLKANTHLNRPCPQAITLIVKLWPLLPLGTDLANPSTVKSLGFHLSATAPTHTPDLSPRVEV